MAYLYCPGCRCLPCCCDEWAATENLEEQTMDWTIGPRDWNDPHDRSPHEETYPVEEFTCPRCRSDCDWREDRDRGDYWWCPSCREIVKPEED